MRAHPEMETRVTRARARTSTATSPGMEAAGAVDYLRMQGMAATPPCASPGEGEKPHRPDVARRRSSFRRRRRPGQRPGKCHRLVAGAIRLLASQMAAARKRKSRQQTPHAAPAAGTERPGRFAGADSPAPDELAEIFKRLGADIPATPPPAPRPPPAPAAPAARPRPAASHRPAAPRRPHMHRPDERRVQPEIARRLARARREAEAAARQVQEARKIPELQDLHGLAVRRDDSQSVHAATRSRTGPAAAACHGPAPGVPSVPMPALGLQRSSPARAFPCMDAGNFATSPVAQTLLHPPPERSPVNEYHDAARAPVPRRADPGRLPGRLHSAAACRLPRARAWTCQDRIGQHRRHQRVPLRGRSLGNRGVRSGCPQGLRPRLSSRG